MTTYDITILAIGIPAVVVGVWAAIRMSKEKFYIVIVSVKRGKEEKK